MDEDPEPERNISGGPSGGGEAAAFESGIESESESGGGTTTRAGTVVDRLGELYWQKAYGGRDAFECLVRTVLSQNTSDAASQPAHDALLERYGPGGAGDGEGAGDRDRDGEGTGDDDRDGEDAADRDDDDHDLAGALAGADQRRLAETIRPAGLYNQKSERIIALAELVREEWGDAAGFDAFVREGDYDEVRDALLEMNGVGPKTADCVLLFAGGREGVFPVDTHVHRIARRMGLVPADADHETVRKHLERDLSGEKCGFGHTAMIQFGREYCTARNPACLDDPEACPLADLCDRVGVDPGTGDVVDPAETVD